MENCCMRYAKIDSAFFVRNRSRLMEILEPDAVTVVNANDVMPTSADGTLPFVQNPDLFYLTGVDQEETILILCPRATDPRHREVLFLRKTDDKIALWEGRRLTRDDGRRISGIETIYWTGEFENIFRQLVVESGTICLNSNEHLRATSPVQTRDMRFADWCRQRFPLHRYERLAPLMQHLRVVKAPEEIEMIREACRITRDTFKRLLGFIRPGVWEYEIEAEMLHEFVRNRSRGPAFSSIVASGPNGCVLHHVRNDRQCRDGELVLMDFGAEYGNYAADLTRTIPVGGRFSPRQRQVYEAVLRVQKGAMAMLVPGTVLADYQKAVGRLMEKELISLGLLDAGAVREQDSDAPLYKKYFPHGTSHHLGLDVHDVGDLCRPLEAGMVLSCEPGIYIPEEAIGVRIETDVLVTEQGPVDLMADVPAAPDHIESLMNG
jgi:Xaa-Pro aminopeptidase